MPGPKTHDICYKQLKGYLSDKSLSHFPNYDKYNIFAQGHDFLIYHNFYRIFSQSRLDSNIKNSELLQEFSFQDFVYNFIKIARNSGAIESEQVRLFLGPGYIMHHILDMYTHPFIIYYSGDHVRDSKRRTWNHGIVENLLDIYMMKKYENKNCKTYPVHKDFSFDKKNVERALIKVLEESLQETYNIDGIGQVFYDSMSQISWFMRILKYDPTGIKKDICDLLDSKLKGTSSFSYHRNVADVKPYLNNGHELWYNPMDVSVTSTESFIDLYKKALIDGAKIVDKLEDIYQKTNLNRQDINDIIPDKASTHGLDCGQKIKIIKTKDWKNSNS